MGWMGRPLWCLVVLVNACCKEATTAITSFRSGLKESLMSGRYRKIGRPVNAASGILTGKWRCWIKGCCRTLDIDRRTAWKIKKLSMSELRKKVRMFTRIVDQQLWDKILCFQRQRDVFGVGIGRSGRVITYFPIKHSSDIRRGWFPFAWWLTGRCYYMISFEMDVAQ